MKSVFKGLLEVYKHKLIKRLNKGIHMYSFYLRTLWHK